MVDNWGDDAGWCWRIKEKGFKVFVDPGVKVGHFKSLTI